VAILFWDGYLSIAPSLLSAMATMTAAGLEVDVFIRGWGDVLPPVGPLPAGARVIQNEVVRRLSFPRSKTTVPNNLGVMLGLPLFLASSLKEAGKRRYSAVFGIDPLGGFCGRLVAARVGAPFFYWSLELFSDPTTLRERILTLIQGQACRAAAGILVQDRLRANALLNGAIAHDPTAAYDKVLLVPNGPTGPPVLRRSDFLRQRLGIPADLKIVLHAGMFYDCVLSYELAESVSSWPGSYCLVLHANQAIPEDNPLVRKIRALNQERVYLSLDPVPASEVDEVIGSAAIGLATYEADDRPNWDLMAAASGKMGCYLRGGLPVICTDQRGMRELMERYHCGVAVAGVNQIPAALEEISSSYETFRDGAVRCYLSEYEFSAHFAAVLDALDPSRACNEAAEHALI